MGEIRTAMPSPLSMSPIVDEIDAIARMKRTALKDVSNVRPTLPVHAKSKLSPDGLKHSAVAVPPPVPPTTREHIRFDEDGAIKERVVQVLAGTKVTAVRNGMQPAVYKQASVEVDDLMYSSS